MHVNNKEMAIIVNNCVGKPVRVRQSLHFDVFTCGDQRNSPKVYKMHVKDEFKVTPFEVDYWKKVYQMDMPEPKCTEPKKAARSIVFTIVIRLEDEL